MPNKHLLLKLSPEERTYLRHWIYEETHYKDGPGDAKRLQLEHRVIPADLAALIAAGLPDLTEQEKAAVGPPPMLPPTWPWSENTLTARVQEANSILAARRQAITA